MPPEAHHTSLPDPPPPSQTPLQPPFQLQPTSRTAPTTPFAMDNAFSDYTQPFQFPSAASTPLNNVWDSPVASSSSTRDGRPRGHSRQSSTSSIPAYVPVNTGRRGSAKDPEALQAALERSKNNRKKRTNSTASVLPPEDDEDEQEIASPGDSTSVLRQRQEDARLIRCDAEQQRRNELGKGYDRLRSALNRGDERLSKARVVERATARVVQLRDQNARMQEELLRRQETINELNRANEQLMLDASGAAPLLVSSPHSASSPSSGRPDSSSRTSVSAFGVGQAGHTHDRSSSLPTPPHTHTGLQYTGDGTNEFGLGPNHSMYHSKQEPFAYGPFEGGGEDTNLYAVAGGPVTGGEFYGRAPPVMGLNPLTAQQRSESPGSYEPTNAFGLPPGDERHLDGSQGQHWLPAHSSSDGIPNWSATSGLPGTFVHQPHNFGSSPSREALGELSEVPASGFPGW